MEARGPRVPIPLLMRRHSILAVSPDSQDRPVVSPTEGCCDWATVVIAQEAARPQIEHPQAASTLSTMDAQQGVILTLSFSYQHEEAPIG